MSIDELEDPGLTFTDYELQRLSWFEELGFSFDQARALTTARDSARQLVTVHDVRVALERGCDVDTAFNIFT